MQRRAPIKRNVVSIRWRAKKAPVVDLAYRAWIRTWPCFICFLAHCREHDIPFWATCKYRLARELFRDQRSIEVCGPTQAAHVGSKGISQMCPEREMMPLGERHHMHPTMGGFHDSHHAGTRTFWEKHGLIRAEVLEFIRHLYLEETGREI